MHARRCSAEMLLRVLQVCLPTRLPFCDGVAAGGEWKAAAGATRLLACLLMLVMLCTCMSAKSAGTGAACSGCYKCPLLWGC